MLIMYMQSSWGILKGVMYGTKVKANENKMVWIRKAISSGKDSLMFPLYPKFNLAGSNKM